MKNKKVIIFLLVVIVFFIYFFSYPRPINGNYISNTGDENLNLFFSKLYAEQGNLKQEITTQYLPSYIFMPRDGAVNGNMIVPQGFLGIFLVGGVLLSIEKNLILIINPLISVLTLVIFLLISLELFNKKISMLNFTISILSVPFWWNASSVFFNHSFALFFYFLGLLYFFKSLKYCENRYIVLYSLFFGISIFFRYIYFLLLMPIFFFSIFNKTYNKKIFEKNNFLIFIILVFLIGFPILYLNNTLYDNPFKTGYSLSYKIINDITGSETKQFYFEPTISYSHIKLYFLNLNIFLIPLFIVGLFRIKFFSKDIKSFYYLNFFYILTIVIFYISGKMMWGHDSFNLNSSFIKYSLPLYLLMIPFVSYTISKFKIKLILIFLFILIVSTFIVAIKAENGLIDNYKYYEKNKEIYEGILNNTENGSIILSRYSDKLLFPDRQTIAISLLNNLSDEDKNNLVKGWNIKISVEVLSDWIIKIYPINKNLYIFDERGEISEYKLNEYLSDKNLKINLIGKYDGKNLYRVEEQ